MGEVGWVIQFARGVAVIPPIKGDKGIRGQLLIKAPPPASSSQQR